MFAQMLSVADDGRYPAPDLSPQQRRQRTMDALITWIHTLARASPVLMIFEDAHWIDPTSLEALGRMVDRIAALPVLLIVTSRPEFRPPWPARPQVTTLAIDRLPPREIGAMIDRVVGKRHIPANIRQDIIERTDGIPLFVEEMTKAVLESETEDEARQTAAAVPASALAVPASLHASLLARLDRLGPAKQVAQIGAAIGREFSHGLLAAVARQPEAELASTLDRLLTAGVIFRQGAAAACDLPVQSCPGAGRGVWHAVARTTRHSRPHRRVAEGQSSRHCGEPAGAAGASLHRSRPH